MWRKIDALIVSLLIVTQASLCCLRAEGAESIGAFLSNDLCSEACITVEPTYIGEVFNNARGGIRTSGATKYQALLDVPITVHLDRTSLAMPGKFVVLGQNTHGRGLTEGFVGDAQVLSNIDSFKNITRVSEYYWEFDGLDHDVTFRIGKQDVNTEFLFVDMAADFVQSTFGLSPSTAFPTYPDPSMGAVVLLQLTESWQLKTGVWDAFASGGGWGISGNDTILLVGELEHRYALADGALPGVIAFGAVYESSGELEGLPISDVQEYYVQFEQWVMNEGCCGAGESQGLGIFAGYYPRFPGRLVTPDSVGDSFVAGATYTGLIPGRDEDKLGLGVAWTELFGGGTGEESAWEFFYKAQLSPGMSVQPDLQYITSPSGIYRDSIVIGLRFELAL